MHRTYSDHNRKKGFSLLAIIINLCCGITALAGAAALLCGFGMSDSMSAPGHFCMLVSVGGAAALFGGLWLRERLTSGHRNGMA